MPLLEIHNLTVEFPMAQGTLRAVDGIELMVEPGEIVGIVGESGSGKSVAMLAVMGLLPWTARVTADRLAFNGIDLLRLGGSQRRRLIGKDMAMIFQEPMTSLNPCFTVGFQLTESMREHEGLSGRRARERAVELLHQVGIPAPERRLKAFPHQLSGGMCQRVMIAIAVACSPQLLIADEPTTALDVTIQAGVLDVFRDLRDRLGTAIILITHDLGVVADIADRAVVMYAGRAVEQATVAELFAAPRHPYTLGLMNALPSAAVDGRLAEIPGMVPSPLSDPDECAFYDRCPRVQTDCRMSRPPLVRQGEEHLAACFHPGGQS